MDQLLILRRSAAAIIDYLLYLAILVAYSNLLGDSPGWTGNVFTFVFRSIPGFFVTSFLWFVYFPGIEAVFGYTLGKGLFDLKVVRERKTDFPLAVSVKRHLLDPIDFFLFGVPAILLVAISEDHKRFGDRWAKSRVLKEGTIIPTFSLVDPAIPVGQLKIEYGGFLRRLGANLIDVVIFIPIAILFYFALRTGNLWLIIPFHVFLGVLNASYTTILHARYGATLGKFAAGLSVRKVDLSRIGWREAVLRSSVDYAFLFFITIGNILTFVAIPRESFAQASMFDGANILKAHQSVVSAAAQLLFDIWIWSEVIVLLFNLKRRALHDFLAGTVVVVLDSLPTNEQISS